MDRSVISVLMPVYNGMPYLRDAIGSLLNQSYGNFEIITVNDGSTDDSGDYLQGLSGRDVRVIHQEHGGIVTALNNGLWHCRGDFIARMDADDLCFSNRLEEQFAYLLDHHLDGVGCWIRFFGDEDRVMEFPEDPDEVRDQLLERTTVAHPTYFFRKAIYEEFQYDPAYQYAEDADFLLRVTEKYRIGNVPSVLLMYRADYKRNRSCEDLGAQQKCVELARQRARERRGLETQVDL